MENIVLLLLARIKQALPASPGFQHKDHPQVLLHAVQQIMRERQIISPEEARRLSEILRIEAQQYRQANSRYVTDDDYKEVWPDIDAMIARASEPIPTGE